MVDTGGVLRSRLECLVECTLLCTIQTQDSACSDFTVLSVDHSIEVFLAYKPVCKYFVLLVHKTYKNINTRWSTQSGQISQQGILWCNPPSLILWISAAGRMRKRKLCKNFHSYKKDSPNNGNTVMESRADRH